MAYALIPVVRYLVVYFSKDGEQYGVGSINEGNTAIIAKMIAKRVGEDADIFEIKVKNDNYPKEYNKLIEYAKKEKAEKVRPEIEGNIDNFDDYLTVFIGYPNWWGDMPMPVYSFLEKYDFSYKNIIPFCTHEGSGLSTTPQKIRETVSNEVKSVDSGFEIFGHIAQNDRIESENKVSNWLLKLGF